MKGKALFHTIKVILGLENPHTQTTLNEQQLISKYSSKVNLAVEIGVYEGFNTKILAKSISSKGRLFAIDPFFKGKLGISYHKIIVKHMLIKNSLSKKVQLIPKLSFDAVYDVPNDLDFIFIDGDHSYEGIKRDWQDWSKKVKKGGFIALHDTSVPKHDPGVAKLGSYKYFHESIKIDNRFELIENVDSLNILRRA